MTTHFFRDGREFTGSDADKAAGQTRVAHNCGKCGGSGNIPSYRHVEGGVCFQCAGHGRGKTTTEKLYTAEKLAGLNATADKKAAAKAAKYLAGQAIEAAKIEARRDEFMAANGAVVAWLETIGRDRDGYYKEGFIGDMLRRAITSADWTPGQATAAHAAYGKAQVREVVKAASKHIGTVGTRLEIVATMERETSYVRERFGYSNGWSDNREEVYISTLRTADGSAIVIKSPTFRAPVGDTMTIRGTVKEHSTYQGEAQTVLQRATIKATQERIAA